jgi:hypothetical protein
MKNTPLDRLKHHVSGAIERGEKTAIEGMTQVHPFERTLGQGPYKYVGFFEINKQAGAMGRPYFDPSLVHPNFKTGAGTCAHCGHAILNIYQVMTGNGEVYGVGSDCIEKVGLPARELTLVHRQALKHQKALRVARKALKGNWARIELSGILADHAEALKGLKNGHRSWLDYASWCLEHSNDGGIVYVLQAVKQIIEKKT